MFLFCTQLSNGTLGVVVHPSPLADPFTVLSGLSHKSDASMSHTCRFPVPCQPPHAPCCPNPNPCQLSPRSAPENNLLGMLLPCRPPACYSLYMLPRLYSETLTKLYWWLLLENIKYVSREPSEDLKYLNIDYTQFDEWSSDEEVTIYTGIEKGYERWLQHPHEDPR